MARALVVRKAAAPGSGIRRNPKAPHEVAVPFDFGHVGHGGRRLVEEQFVIEQSNGQPAGRIQLSSGRGLKLAAA